VLAPFFIGQCFILTIVAATPIIAVTANPSSPLVLRSFTHRFGKYDRFTLLLLPPLAP
jgi:hypothetical protein